MNLQEKYEKVLYWFKEISKIPRNSTKEEKIANWLCNFANERGLEVYTDNMHNVLIKKPATPGWENKNAIVLQSHIDMVCEKTEDSNHNFDIDPIEIIESENTFTANNTTLGADDGIGVAYCLLMLDGDEIEHPYIYCLFTSQEEIGMDGAKAFDYSKIFAKYLINLDDEKENVATVSCAGGVTLIYKKEYNEMSLNGQFYELKISGLAGGHSGEDINKNRINANTLAFKILDKFQNIRIASYHGGSKTNAIPVSASCIFTTTSEDLQEIANRIKRSLVITREDADINIQITPLDEQYPTASQSNSRDLLGLGLYLKQGIIKMSDDIVDLVETSSNIGIINIENGKAEFQELLRSSDDLTKEQVKYASYGLANRKGFVVTEEGEYPGWKYEPNTNIEKAFVQSYQNTHNGSLPTVKAIHAGLECGIIKQKMPHVEMIAMGPNLKNVHTTNETLYLDSCKKVLETLIELIKNLD